MEHTIPSCRYGHGELALLSGDPSNHRFALTGVLIHERPSIGETPVSPSGRVFTVAAYKCPTCGYIEFFDDEARNG